MPLGAARFGLLGGVADLGKLELIETQTITTSSSSIDFTTLNESTYNVHFVTFNNLQHTTNDKASLPVALENNKLLTVTK